MEREELPAAKAPALAVDAEQLWQEHWCPEARVLEAWQLFWRGSPTQEVEVPPPLVDEVQVAVLAAGDLGRWGLSCQAGQRSLFLRCLALVLACQPARWE